MKRYLIFLSFLLCVSVACAEVPNNYPADSNYIVKDGKIFIQGGEFTRLGFHADNQEDAERLANYYAENIRNADYVQGVSDFLTVPEIVHIYYNDSRYTICVFVTVPMLGYAFDSNLVPEMEMDFMNGGIWTYSFYQKDFSVYYADAQYDDPAEPEPALPDGLSDGVVTFHDGALVYTSEGFYSPNGSTVIFSGPSLWASSEEEAETCARNFSSFSQSYSWVFHDEPEIPLWTEPKVYKCYSITNGEASFIFWRIFFQDYTSLPAAAEFDSAYGQILNDYSQGAGGSGGYNVIALYGESAEASAVNVGTNLLNGETIGQGNSGTSSITLKSGSSDVTVAQDTVQNISARNTVGVSEVTSNASVDEDSNGNINVTNQTTINTTIELGDAPTGGEFVDDSDLGEKEVNSFFDEERTEEPPVFTYVEIYNEDYRINYSKLWDDIKLELGNIFPIEALESYFNRSGNSGTMPVIPVQASFPEVGFYFDYAIDMNEVLVNDITLIVRQILSFLIVFETAILCLNLVRG